MATNYNPGVPMEGLVAFFNPSEERGLPGDGTNIVTNTDLITGWDRNSYNAGIVQNDGANPPGVASSFNNFSFYDNNTDGYSYWFSYGDYLPAKVQGALYRTTVWTKTRDKNFNINMYTADNSEVGRVSSDNVTIPSDQQWYRPSWIWQNPTNSQSKSLSFNYTFGNSQGEAQRSWLCYPEVQRITQLADLSGGRNNCTISSNVGYAGWRNGHLQTYVTTDSYLTSNMTMGSYFPVDAPWTWTVWAKATSVPTADVRGVLIGCANYGGAAIYWYSNGSNVQPFGYLRQTSAYRNTTFGTMNTNQWYHLTMVNSYSDTSFKFYMNGVLVGSAARDNTAYGNGAASLTWGISKPNEVDGGGTSTYRGFPGQIGKIMLYNNEFSATQVAQHYQAQRGFYGV